MKTRKTIDKEKILNYLKGTQEGLTRAYYNAKDKIEKEQFNKTGVVVFQIKHYIENAK